MKWLRLIPFLLFALPAFATGGTCPAGSTYVNLTTGAQTGATLSSYGITSCYFISAAGLDTNTGLDEAHSWLHSPGMPSCSNNCSTINTQCSANNCGGIGFIFRGGDSWHFGAATSPSTGGTLNMSAGLPSSSVYFGVDQTWFTGGSWARPIFTADNAVCGPNNVGGSCHSGALSNYNLLQYYVTSCANQVGGANNIIQTSGSSHYIFDNFEITGLCQSSVGQPSGHDQYFTYGSSGDMRFLNLYVHGWTHQQFVDVNGGGSCGLCLNIFIFAGGKSGTPDDVYKYVSIDGADSDPVGATACYCDFWDVSYSYIGNQSGVITRFQHLYHDNLYEYWYENGHGNVMESVGDAPGTNAFYNNVTRHINTSNDPGDPMYWPFPPVGTTLYWFNNLSYDVTKMQYYNIGQNGSQHQGAIINFNNTFQNNVISGGGIFSCNVAQGLFTWTAANNHYITQGANAYSTNNCTTGGNTDTTSLLMNNGTATTDNYTNAQTFAYSPTSGGSPTVGQGTNKNTAYCGALTTAGLTSAAAACQSDTTYACSYNSSTHQVTCPARTANARPASAAWDEGTYQFTGAGQASPPSCSPGTGNYAATQTITCTNPNSGTTVMCYRTDGGIPATANDGMNCSVGTKYTTTISISGPNATTLNVIAGTSVLPDSIVPSYIYTFIVSTPIFSPPAGNYPVNQAVTITSDSGSTICYTDNGIDPVVNNGNCTTGNVLANGGSVIVTVNGETLKAIAYKTGFTNSLESTAVYNIGLITYVPSNCSTIGSPAGNTNATSFSCTPAQTGDAVAIFVACHASSGTPSSVALAASGWTFTALSGLIGTGSGLVGQIFGAVAPNTSSTTFTATWAGVGDCASNSLEISGEFSGTNLTGGTTTFNATGTSGGASGGCNQSAANVTPLLANEAVWFACLDTATRTNSPWSLGVSDSNGDLSEYQTLTGGAGVAQTPSFTSSGGYIVMGVALTLPVNAPGGTMGTGIGYGPQVGIH